MRKYSFENFAKRSFIGMFILLVIGISGCHDGPLYALKHVNPYFTMKEWREDDAIGVTDHERRNQLVKLTSKIEGMPAKDQAFWAGHLQRILDNDPSPEMRRLAVNASGKLRTPAAIQLMEKGLEDDNLKVRMESCRALGKRNEAKAVELLAKVAGSETEQDVKHSAIAALGSHKNPIAVNSLRTALRDRDPATQDLAMNSLKSVTGKDLGNPSAWIRALENQSGGPAIAAGAPAGSPPVNGAVQQVAGSVIPSSTF